MSTNGIILWTSFLSISSLFVLVALLVSGRKSRLAVRLDDLAGKKRPTLASDPMLQLAQSALPRMGTALLPEDEDQRTRLRTRLIQAGLYRREALIVFLGVKLILIVGPALLGLAAGVLGLIQLSSGLMLGAILGIGGVIVPGLWLDKRKATRQTAFRRALPDALDVLVICLEGGLSLPGALRRMASELRSAHPLLANELNIVQREVQLGRSTGEALRQFGERTDLEELRSLASVILQSERFGASLVKAMRTHAETLRYKRLQYAEEMAQKAATKILFPTLIFIFPGVFIVILGPAAFHLLNILRSLQ
jgi:tight adherence protein C